MSANRLPRRLRRLVLLALREGWQVQINPDLRLSLTKPGFAAIHTGADGHDAREVVQRGGSHG